MQSCLFFNSLIASQAGSNYPSARHNERNIIHMRPTESVFAFSSGLQRCKSTVSTLKCLSLNSFGLHILQVVIKNRVKLKHTGIHPGACHGFRNAHKRFLIQSVFKLKSFSSDGDA